MELVVLGLSHQTAPIDVRERLAVVPAEIEVTLQRLVALPGVSEAALISTCNRVEIYAAAADGRAALASLRDQLRAQADGLEIDAHLRDRLGREALLHLFRVAASLDSLVV